MDVWYAKTYIYQDSTDEYIKTKEVGIFSSKEKAMQAIEKIKKIWTEEDTYIVEDYISYTLDTSYFL